MKGNISVDANEIHALENLHVVFEEKDHRRVLVKEIYLYCDMMSDWIEVTEILKSRKSFMDRLNAILEDYLVNMELERLTSL